MGSIQADVKDVSVKYEDCKGAVMPSFTFL